MDESEAKYISELEQENLELQSKLNNLVEAAIPYSDQIKQLQAENERLKRLLFRARDCIADYAYKKSHRCNIADDILDEIAALKGD